MRSDVTKTPWLDIPLAEYEAHMALPSVGQAQLLADALEESVTSHQPRSLAILGCAGGNGFECLRGRALQRVVGVDINPDYIRAAAARFSSELQGLELFVGDVQTNEFPFAPVDLVFAGLLFEYVDPLRALPKICAMLRSGGTLVAVLQLPCHGEDVTPSRYESLASLSGALRLVSPQQFELLAASAGFVASDARVLTASGGKQFFVQRFHAARCRRITSSRS